MLSPAQVAKIDEIRNAPGFVQDSNDPEAATANRAKPAPVAYMYIDGDGFHSVRIGTGGNLLASKIS